MNTSIARLPVARRNVTLAATSAANPVITPGATPAAPTVKAATPELGRYIGAILPLSILALWLIATSNKWLPPVFLPSPWQTIQAFSELLKDGKLLEDFMASLRIVAMGFALGASLGLLLGTLSGVASIVERFFAPTFDALRQIPPMAWLPLVILWVGVGDVAKVVVITKVVFFPVFLNTLQGIRSVPKEYIEVARVLRLTRWQLARKLIIPSALPSILVGVRYAAGLSWSLLVAAEMLSGMKGLGFLMWRAQELLFTDQLLVVIFIIGLVGFVLDRSLFALQCRLLRWQQGYAG